MLKNKLNDSPSLKERLEELFDKYHEVAETFFYLKDKEMFAKKIKNTRNVLEHSSTKNEKEVLHNEEMYYAVQDLKMLLKICFLTQLGFTLEEIKQRLHAF